MSTIHSVLSGLWAYAKQIEVSANNVANVNTDEFKKSHTELVSVETGGVLPVVRKDDSAGPMVLRDSGYGPIQVELSNRYVAKIFVPSGENAASAPPVSVGIVGPISTTCPPAAGATARW